jgi:hypothetical protein
VIYLCWLPGSAYTIESELTQYQFSGNNHDIIFYHFILRRGRDMALTQLATRVDKRVKQAVEEVCQARGLKMNRFIEEALIDKLEELEDIEDLKKLRCEPSRPLSEILTELKLDG